jgi:hypothetical protein
LKPSPPHAGTNAYIVTSSLTTSNYTPHNKRCSLFLPIIVC